MLNILLVEDNRVNQRVAQKLLVRLGHKVVLAENGREAVEAFEKQLYDVVLMDCHMPIMDGYEAAQKIRLREKHRKKKTRIIAVTAYIMDENRELCRASGMDDFIEKPVSSAILAEKLQD